MRFILTAAVWVVILTLVTSVFSIRPSSDDASPEAIKKSEHMISFEITPTFNIEQDPFALRIEEDPGAFSIILDGETVYSAKSGIYEKVVFTTEEYGLTPGRHELFIKANPADTSVSHALRVRVLEVGNPLMDETEWFQPGQSINASYAFDLLKEEHKNEH